MNVFRGKKSHKVAIFLILAVSTLLACFALFASRQASAAPTTMNFQGRLGDASGNIVPNGTYNMQFRLFTVASGGSATWTETRETTNRVTVTNGLFSVQLGAVTPLSASLFSGNDVYFEITLPTPATATCNTASCASWESAMTPRHKMATSAYAFNSDTLDGLDSTAFATGSGSANYIQNTTSPQTANFSIAGTGVITSSLTVPTVSSGSNLTLQAATGNNININPGANGGGSGTLNLAVNAATLNIGNNSNNIRTISIGNTAGSQAQTVTIGNNGGTSSVTTLQGSGGILLQTNASGVGATVKSVTDSTIAFRIQNASNATLFNVDTIANNIILGTNTTLSLTGGNTASRPGTTSEGMMYYDTTTKQTVTYSNGKWQADSKSATFIVAASNSSQATKDGAQYVANGEDSAGSGIGTLDGDQVQINNALTAASTAGGGVVYLAEGTYTIDASISIPNNVTLAGYGNGSLIQLGNFGATSTSIDMIVNADATTGQGVKVRDLKLDGRNNINTSGTTSGVAFNNMGDYTASRIGSTISDLFITRLRSDAIYIQSSDNNVISNNTVDGGNGEGISVYSDSVYNTVSGNKVSDVGCQGFNIYGSYTTITNNSAINNTSCEGFYIGSDNSTLTGNISKGNNSGFEIEADNIVISSNTSMSNVDRGIGVIYSSDVTISDNVVQSNGDGGIEIFAVNRAAITGNTVSGNTTHGIQVGGSSGNTSTNVAVAGNVIYNNGGSGANHSIFVDTYVTDAKITGNKINDTAGSGNAIRMGATAVNNTYLSDNVFSGTGATMISDAGTGTIYAKQSVTAGGLDMLTRQAASATAFQIQNASSVAMLTADSTNSRIEVGSSTTDATAIFFTLDRYNNGTDPTGVDGAMYYNTNLNKFRCYQNGVWADCITTAISGANTALSNLASVAINTSLVSDTTNTDDLGSSVITWRSGYFGTSLSTPVLRPSADGTSAFKLQNTAGTVDFLTLDTTNSRLTIGTSDTAGTLLVLDTKTNAGDPTGVDGGMYYNSSTHQFRCYRDGQWESCSINPIDRGFVMDEEFMGGSSTSDGAMGALGWSDDYITGTNASNTIVHNNGITPTADRPGILRLFANDASPVTNNGLSMFLGDSGSRPSWALAAGNAVKTAVAVGSASTNTQVLRVGLHNTVASTTAPTTGVWWEADPDGSANWQYCYTNGTPTATCAASGTAIAANTFVRLEIRITALGSGTSAVTFIINGTASTVSSVTVNTTNLVFPAIACYAKPASAQSCYADYFQVRGVTSAAR